MTVTGAVNIFGRFISIASAASFALPSSLRTQTNLAGLKLADVQPPFHSIVELANRLLIDGSIVPFTAAVHLGACAIDPMLSVRFAAVGLLDSNNGPLDSSSEVTKYRCCPSKK